MRHLTTILLLFFTLISAAQNEDLFPDVAWRTNVADVTVVNDSTYQFKVMPQDINEPGAGAMDYGNYFIDYIGHIYEVVDSAYLSVTVEDVFDYGVSPQRDRIGVMYNSADRGMSPYLAPISYRYLHSIAPDNVRKIELAVMWEHGMRYPYYYFNLDTTYEVTGEETKGISYWDEEHHTISDVMNEGVILQRGHELYRDVKNTSGDTLLNGTPVMYAGSIGASGKLQVQKAIADGSINPNHMFGLATEEILNNEFGKVAVFGDVRGINTTGANYGETWVLGDSIFVSPETPGYLTNQKPEAPDYQICVGFVSVLHANNGQISLNQKQNSKITDAADVNDTPLTESGQIMVWDEDNQFFDFDYNINNYVPDSIWNNINSAARLWGGVITVNGSGTVNVAAGAGIMKEEHAGAEDEPSSINDGQGSKIHYVEWDARAGLTLTDNAYNYIFFDGTDSTIKATTNFYSISFTQDFTLGRAYRNGTDVVVRLCGTNAWNFNRRVQLFGEEVFPIIRGTGLNISDAGGLQFDISEGVLWAELVNRFTVGEFIAGTNFTYWKSDGLGGWNSSTATTINNTQYDDGDGTLATLNPNRFGNHYVYVVHDGSVHVVYGRGNYTANEYPLAPAPPTLPGLLDAYATLVGRITVERGATELTEVVSAFTETFATTQVNNHNDLGGLDGGEAGYYGHLTSDDAARLDNWKDSINANEIDPVYAGDSANILKNDDFATTLEAITGVVEDKIISPYTNAMADTARNVPYYGGKDDLYLEYNVTGDTLKSISLQNDIGKIAAIGTDGKLTVTRHDTTFLNEIESDTSFWSAKVENQQLADSTDYLEALIDAITVEESNTLDALTGEKTNVYISPEKLIEVIKMIAFQDYGQIDDVYAPDILLTIDSLQTGLSVGDARIDSTGALVSTPEQTNYTGAIDGTNDTFTLDSEPNEIWIYLNGIYQIEDVHYTLSGDIVTFNEAPYLNDILTIKYK